MHASFLCVIVFGNILVWLIEQFVPHNFEFLCISYVLNEFQNVAAIQYAFNGIRAGVLALLLKALWTMYKKCPKCKRRYSWNPDVGKMCCPYCRPFGVPGAGDIPLNKILKKIMRKK